MDVDQTPSVKLWRNLRSIDGIKHIRVASGVRYDLILKDYSGAYLRDLCKYHVGGQLKVAPEHISSSVTNLMGKPGRKEYDAFVRAFDQMNKYVDKQQYLVPYFISGHPGSGLSETIELTEFVRDAMEYYPEQVQNFTPTPMTISTCMYHTGLNPADGSSVYVPDSPSERKIQRALLQFRNKKNIKLIRETLVKANRYDLIGSSPKALVREQGESYHPKRKIEGRQEHASASQSIKNKKHALEAPENETKPKTTARSTSLSNDLKTRPKPTAAVKSPSSGKKQKPVRGRQEATPAPAKKNIKRIRETPESANRYDRISSPKALVKDQDNSKNQGKRKTDGKNRSASKAQRINKKPPLEGPECKVKAADFRKSTAVNKAGKSKQGSTGELSSRSSVKEQKPISAKKEAVPASTKKRGPVSSGKAALKPNRGKKK